MTNSWLIVGALVVVVMVFVLFRRMAERGVPDPAKIRAVRQTPASTPGGASARDTAAPSGTVLSPPSRNSIEVAEGDPLIEAVVYLEFGYLDRAAQILREYVDGPGRGNREILRKLLDVYLRIERVDDYAEILERLSDAGEDAAFVQAALLAGLTADFSNLQLRVLADSRLGLGPQHLSKLLGHELVLDDDQGAEGTSPGAADATTPASGQGTGARLVLRLIEGGMRLTSSFSTEEKAMLRVFTHPAHEARIHRAEARLHRTAGDIDAAIDALRRAIAVRPQALVNFADLLRILHGRGEIDDYAKTFWQLCLVLDGAGRALRDRFLGMGRALGVHPLLEALSSASDRHRLESAGREFGLISSVVPPRKLTLVEATAVATEELLTAHAEDILHHANAFLEFGQVEEAIDTLEQAVLADPTDTRLYPPLLDIYDRMDELDRLKELSAKVKRLIHQLPEEVAPMMLSLRQRLHDRRRDVRSVRG